MTYAAALILGVAVAVARVTGWMPRYTNREAGMRQFRIDWHVSCEGQEGGRQGTGLVEEGALADPTLDQRRLVKDLVGVDIQRALREMEHATRPADLGDETRHALTDLHAEMRDDGQAFETRGNVEMPDLARGYAERIGGMLSGR